jgi:hypothetical protein
MQNVLGELPASETEKAIPTVLNESTELPLNSKRDASGKVYYTASERHDAYRYARAVANAASIDTAAPQTIEQIAAELDVDFDFENVVANERNFEEMFKQASQGTIEVNANTVADLRKGLLSDAEIEANNDAAIKSITAADLVNETALSNREKTSERSGQLSAEELMSKDKPPTSSGSASPTTSSNKRKPSLAQRMQETRKAGQSAQKSLDKYKDSDEAKKIAQTGSQEQIKALERTSDVVRDMQRGVQRGFKKGGLASRKK